MPEQKQLFLLNNQNLFSNNYLEHRLPAASLWKGQGEKAGEVFARIKKLYEAVKPLKLGSGEEAGIEEKFIRPVLKTLGYEFDVQPRTQRGYKKSGLITPFSKTTHLMKRPARKKITSRVFSRKRSPY